MAYSNNWICTKLFNFSRRKDIQVLKLDTIVECSNVAQGKFYKKKKKNAENVKKTLPWPFFIFKQAAVKCESKYYMVCFW